jgi:hypothetical protein
VAKKNAKTAPTICTFCGKPASPVTWDDPFPKALWAGPSKDRPLKVAGCAPCNNRSYEATLKHFFVVFDSRFHSETLSHFKKPGGKGDLRTFRKMWAEIGGVDKRENSYEVRKLPLRVGVANPAQPVPADFAEMLNEPMQYKFRDFSYEWFANDENGMAMGLRYEREEYAELGNRLYLLCFVPNL